MSFMPCLSPISNNKVRLVLDVSSELHLILDELAKNSSTSKGDILRRSIALMDLAVKEQKKGNRLLLISEDESEKKEIVGLS